MLQSTAQEQAPSANMDALPDVLVAAVLAALPLDECLRCAVLSRRFLRLVREAPHTRCLSFDGVPRVRRCAVDGAALGVLIGRAAATLTRVDLSALPQPPRGALSPVDAVAALQRGAPPGALREARAWHAGFSSGAQYDIAQLLCEAAYDARSPAPLVALLRGHLDSYQGVISFAHGLVRVLLAARVVDEEAGVFWTEAGADAADVAADAGAATALLAALAAHPDNGHVGYECLQALSGVARVNPDNVAPGAPRAAAAAAALRWLQEWDDDDDCAVAVRALTLFAPVPSPEALDAVVATMERTESHELRHACVMFISEQRAGGAAHADAPFCAVLRVAEVSDDIQDRMLSLVVLQELLEARRSAVRRSSPPLPPHPEAARLLAVCVAALRPRIDDADDERRIHLFAGADQLLRYLFACEGVTLQDVLAAGGLPAVMATLRSMGAVTDVSAPIWCRIMQRLCRLLAPRRARFGAPDAKAEDAAEDAAFAARAAAAVAAGVHEAARAAAAARPTDADVQNAACCALNMLAQAVSEEDIVRPGGLLETALAARRSTADADADSQTMAFAAVQRLVERSERCKERMHALLGVREEYEPGRRGPWSFPHYVSTGVAPAMTLPPAPPKRDKRVIEAMASTLAVIPVSLQLHMARAAAAASLRRCIAQVRELDSSASAPPHRARRSEAFAACAAVLAVADGVDAGRRFEAAVRDEDGEDEGGDALVDAAKAAAIAATAASRGAEALAVWNSVLVTLALMGELAIVEASQGAA
jgi:hypothetical protein